VIVVTASYERPTRANVRQVLRKPLMPEQLIAAIERCLSSIDT
jgi:hypothetical protein